ncbi:PCMP-E39 [Symbiodinium natans]|uniref:PCMP-E39 protein n=1 Tax=Symbiodinium natans TaxID=878477 RepID=A0A812V018_9DINO|nr:PCMP-E39 [Symbiodinium natans]
MMMSNFVLAPDIVSFNAAASACEKRSQWCWALWIASQRERCLPKMRGPELLTISNACISACAKARRLSEALALGLEVEAPDKVTYNALVTACRSPGGERWDMLFALMRRMQRRRLLAGADVLGPAVEAALEAGEAAAARPLMKRLEQSCVSELAGSS